MQLRRDAEVVAPLERLVALKPDHANGWNYWLSGALLSQRRGEEALAAQDRALALHPGNPDWLANRGMLLQSLGRYAELLEALDQAVAARPNHARRLNILGAVSLALSGRPEEALRNIEEALAIAPTFNAHYNHAGVLADLGASRTRWRPMTGCWRWRRGMTKRASIAPCCWSVSRPRIPPSRIPCGQGAPTAFAAAPET